MNNVNISVTTKVIILNEKKKKKSPVSEEVTIATDAIVV